LPPLYEAVRAAWKRLDPRQRAIVQEFNSAFRADRWTDPAKFGGDGLGLLYSINIEGRCSSRMNRGPGHRWKFKFLVRLHQFDYSLRSTTLRPMGGGKFTLAAGSELGSPDCSCLLSFGRPQR
jgi:hypothetical protein